MAAAPPCSCRPAGRRRCELADHFLDPGRMLEQARTVSLDRPSTSAALRGTMSPRLCVTAPADRPFADGRLLDSDDLYAAREIVEGAMAAR